jgi:proline iminopeptidase
MAVALVNGTELFYTRVGEGLPCLVMHGGLGLDHTYLHPSLDPLGDTLQLIYYDHRGNGRSGRPDKQTMTHAQFADDAAALASHLEHEQVAVLGHSYGGFIALEFALRHPDRVSHLVLLDTAPVAPESGYPDEIAANALRMGATQEMQEAMQRDVTTDEELRESLSIFYPIYFKHYDPVIGARLLENLIVTVSGDAIDGDAYNVTARLGEIQTPTLVMVGRDDWICPPSQAHILHDGISGSELVIFEESGHFPYVEESEAFFKTIRDWIKKNNPLVR